MRHAKTQADFIARLNEHMMLTFPSLGSVMLREEIQAQWYPNGYLMRFIDTNTGELTDDGAIKVDRYRWVVQSQQESWTTTRLKEFMRNTQLNWVHIL